MTLGQRIQELRKGTGLSQEGLGEALGVSRQAVSKWESDGGIPELDTLIAMSRLFGVTLGGLLGVEAPRGEEEDRSAASPVDEAVMEEALRRFSKEQEDRRTRAALAAENDPRRRRYRKYAAAGAGVLAGLLLLFGLRLYEKMERMQRNINDLESSLLRLDNSIGSQIYSITGQIQAILDDQNDLLSGAEWTVTAFDHRAGTVELRHRLTLKSYAPGTELQLQLRWETVEGETGELTTGWAQGPDFVLDSELPMNYALERTVRIRDPEGGIREQPLDPVYDGMHPDNFTIYSKGLSTPFVIHVGNSVTAMAESGPAVILMSSHPDLFWPVSARLTATLNGETAAERELTLSADGRGSWRGETEAVELYLREGDEVLFEAVVTDNLGRTIRLREGYLARDGHMRDDPMAAEAPSIVVYGGD